MIDVLLYKWQSLATFLITVDKDLFRLINQLWINNTFDQLMPWVTNINETLWIGLIVVAILLYKLRLKAVVAILSCVMAVAIADVTAAQVIKPLVQRPRPQFTEKNVRLLVPPQGSYGFPSNHAANVFAASTVLGLMLTGLGPFAFLMAALIAYSRVYVGVHYPLDVIGGGILGFLSGLLVFYLYKLGHRFLFPKSIPSVPKKWRKKNRGDRRDSRKKDTRLPSERLG